MKANAVFRLVLLRPFQLVAAEGFHLRCTGAPTDPGEHIAISNACPR